MQALLSQYNMLYVTVGFFSILVMTYWAFKCVRWVIRVVKRIGQAVQTLFAQG